MPIPQQRVWHYLSNNAKTRHPSNLLFVDTETMPHATSAEISRHLLRCWCATACRLENGKQTRHAFATSNMAQDFWSFVETRCDKRRPLWIFAHNVAFDMITLGLANVLETESFTLQISRQELSQSGDIKVIVEREGLCVLDSPPTILEIFRQTDKSKVVIVDTMNYYRCSLRELGESIGLPKMPLPDFDAPTSCWQSYCANDVAIIEKAIIGLINTVKRHDLGNFRYTITSQGMQAYRHRFMQHKILVHCNENALKLERDSYFGGNCTMYRLGEVAGPIYTYDVKSFYPSICMKYALPHELIKFSNEPIEPSAIRWLSPNWVIAQVTWNHDTRTAPIRYRGRLVQATGRFKTSLHLPELSDGLMHNAIEKIHCLAIYQCNRIFARVMQAFLTLRSNAEREGNKVEEKLFKLLANGMTGKTAQRQVKWIDCPNQDSPFAWGTWKQFCRESGMLAEWRAINWRVQRKRHNGEPANVYGLKDYPQESSCAAINDESPNSCPAIAGAITSWGRFILQQLIDIVGLENVYYTDTDCLHVGPTGKSRIEAAAKSVERLGIVLQQSEPHREGNYIGIKFYSLDGSFTIAGVKKQAKVIADGVYSQHEFNGWPSFVSFGPSAIVEERRVVIDRSDEWIPGTILPDGIITPLRIEMTGD